MERAERMSTNRMDVIDLRRGVVDEYKGFATSFSHIRAEDIRQHVDALYERGREPLA